MKKQAGSSIVGAWGSGQEILGGRQTGSVEAGGGLTHARFSAASLFHPSLGPGPPISARGPCRLHTFLQYSSTVVYRQHLVGVDWS